MAKEYSDTDMGEGTKYANMGKPVPRKAMVPPARPDPGNPLTPEQQAAAAALLRAMVPPNYYTQGGAVAGPQGAMQR